MLQHPKGTNNLGIWCRCALSFHDSLILTIWSIIKIAFIWWVLSEIDKHGKWPQISIKNIQSPNITWWTSTLISEERNKPCVCLRKATESSIEPHRFKIPVTLFKTEISAGIFPPIEGWSPALSLTGWRGPNPNLTEPARPISLSGTKRGIFQISAIFPIKIAGARHQRAGYSFKIAFIL